MRSNAHGETLKAHSSHVTGRSPSAVVRVDDPFHSALELVNYVIPDLEVPLGKRAALYYEGVRIYFVGGITCSIEFSVPSGSYVTGVQKLRDIFGAESLNHQSGQYDFTIDQNVIDKVNELIQDAKRQKNIEVF